MPDEEPTCLQSAAREIMSCSFMYKVDCVDCLIHRLLKKNIKWDRNIITKSINKPVSDQQYYYHSNYIHSSFTFRGVVLGGFENLWGHPENKYATHTLQWIGESKSFDNSNRSSIHTAWYSRNWGGGGDEAAPITMVLQRIFLVGGGRRDQLFTELLYKRGVLDPHSREKRGWVYSLWIFYSFGFYEALLLTEIINCRLKTAISYFRGS
jgi:hypothetical protein